MNFIQTIGQKTNFPTHKEVWIRIRFDHDVDIEALRRLVIVDATCRNVGKCKWTVKNICVKDLDFRRLGDVLGIAVEELMQKPCCVPPKENSASSPY